jgi:hypothetical protein
MKSKTWVIIAKIFAVVFAAYGVILLMGVARDVRMYNNSPAIYNNGLSGVLSPKIMEIALGVILLAGGILMLLNKKTGWILQLAGQLMISALILWWIIVEVPGSGKNNKAGTIAGFALIGALVLFALAAMYYARHHYRIRTRDTIAVGILIVFYITALAVRDIM